MKARKREAAPILPSWPAFPLRLSPGPGDQEAQDDCDAPISMTVSDYRTIRRAEFFPTAEPVDSPAAAAWFGGKSKALGVFLCHFYHAFQKPSAKRAFCSWNGQVD
jgi:hypothetical protein